MGQSHHATTAHGRDRHPAPMGQAEHGLRTIIDLLASAMIERIPAESVPAAASLRTQHCNRKRGGQ